jgi:hypothetical protein
MPTGSSLSAFHPLRAPLAGRLPGRVADQRADGALSSGRVSRRIRSSTAGGMA